MFFSCVASVARLPVPRYNVGSQLNRGIAVGGMRACVLQHSTVKYLKI